MITEIQSNRIANFLFGNDRNELDLISPEKFYIGLSSSKLEKDGKIAGELSTDGTGYQRIEVVNSRDVFGSASNGVVTNSATDVKWTTALTQWDVASVFITYSKDSMEAMYVTNTSITVPAGVTLFYEKNTLQLSIEAGDEAK